MSPTSSYTALPFHHGSRVSCRRPAGQPDQDRAFMGLDENIEVGTEPSEVSCKIVAPPRLGPLPFFYSRPLTSTGQ